MAMQQKAVGDDADARLRPMPSHQRHEFGQPGMDRRLAAEQVKMPDVEAAAPSRHPALGLRQIEIATVAVIGIVRAALAGQIASVRDM